MATITLEDLKFQPVLDHRKAIDVAIHCGVFGHSSLNSEFVAREYSTDPRACKILIDLLEETYAWFDISRLDSEIEKRKDYLGNNWQVCLSNSRHLTERGQTMEIAVCNVCLLGEVTYALREAERKNHATKR